MTLYDAAGKPHSITVDEETSSGPHGGDTMFKAFCECGWSADHWRHADEYEVPVFDDEEPSASNPADLAHLAAQLDGDDHLTEIEEN